MVELYTYNTWMNNKWISKVFRRPAENKGNMRAMWPQQPTCTVVQATDGFSGAEPHTKRKAWKKYSGLRFFYCPRDRPAWSQWSNYEFCIISKSFWKIIWGNLAKVQTWNWTFQQDNDAPHTRKSTGKWHKKRPKGESYENWSYRPDLSLTKVLQHWKQSMIFLK